MAFNINTFISTMTRDGARPNLFEIFFTELGQTFSFRATATALPASTIGVARAYYFGREAKFAGDRVFADWTVNVILDETDFLAGGARYALESWSNALKSHVGNIRNPADVNPQVYQKDAKVILYAKDASTAIAEYNMKGCFPIDVAAIPVDWSANDQIMQFPITFAMQWWERIPATDAA